MGGGGGEEGADFLASMSMKPGGKERMFKKDVQGNVCLESVKAHVFPSRKPEALHSSSWLSKSIPVAFESVTILKLGTKGLSS